jgi:hypothetical protein
MGFYPAPSADNPTLAEIKVNSSGTPHSNRPVKNLQYEFKVKNKTLPTKENDMKTVNNAVVAIYKSHTEAEGAVKELQQSGFDMQKLSIVGRDYHTD